MPKKCMIEHSVFYGVKSFLKQMKTSKFSSAAIRELAKCAGDTAKLDEQIEAFCEKLEVTPELIEGVEQLHRDIEVILERAVRNTFGKSQAKFRLLKYGNLVNGLFSKLDTSISFTVVTDSSMAHRDLLDLIRAAALADPNGRSLARLQIHVRKQGLLLQFFDLDLNINVKIRINKKASITNALVILQYCRASKIFKQLAHILKEWNFEKKESRRKNRGNFQLHLLLIAYMQKIEVLPEISKTTFNQSFSESPTYSPGQILIGFFQFYQSLHPSLSVFDPFS